MPLPAPVMTATRSAMGLSPSCHGLLRHCGPASGLGRCSGWARSDDKRDRRMAGCGEERRHRDAPLRRHRPGPSPHLRPDQGLLDAARICAGYNPIPPTRACWPGFASASPQSPSGARDACWTTRRIDFVVLAAVPRDRAELAIAAMRRGKHVMVDKPGVTTADQLAAVAAQPWPRPAASGPSRWAADLARDAGGAARRALRRARPAGALPAWRRIG